MKYKKVSKKINKKVSKKKPYHKKNNKTNKKKYGGGISKKYTVECSLNNTPSNNKEKKIICSIINKEDITPSPTAVPPPTSVPPTAVPPTAVPPTAVPSPKLKPATALSNPAVAGFTSPAAPTKTAAPTKNQGITKSWANEANEIEKEEKEEKEEIEQVKQLLIPLEIPEPYKIIKISKYTRENFNNNQKETYKYFLIMIEQENEIILLKTDQNIQNIKEIILILNIQKINHMEGSQRVNITSNAYINNDYNKMVEMNISLIFINQENIDTFKQFLVDEKTKSKPI